MVEIFKEIWSEAYQAAAINTATSADFGNDSTTIKKKDRYGMANSLVLSSLADEDFEIRLDGLDSRLIAILYTRGSFIIDPRDGIFFSHVRLTNKSATNSSAGEINIRIARSIPAGMGGNKNGGY